MKSRSQIIDIMKGICITLMVACHAGMPFSKLIYFFHMSVFFMISGYTYNVRHSVSFQSFLRYVISRINRLWKPYYVATVSFVILHNFFIKIHVYTDNPLFLNYVSGPYNCTMESMTVKKAIISLIKGITFHCNTQLGGALWFLQILFWVSIFYSLTDLTCKSVILSKDSWKRSLIKGGMSFVLVVLSWRGYGILGLTSGAFQMVCSYFCLLYMGELIRKYDSIGLFNKQSWILKTIILFVSTDVLIYLYYHCDRFELGRNYYVNPFYLFLGSISGWFFIHIISEIISIDSILKKVLQFIGKHTMPILILHFLMFKIVSYIGLVFDRRPMFLAASFPVLYEGGIWWVLYSIAGIGIPLLLNYVISFLQLLPGKIEVIIKKG